MSFLAPIFFAAGLLSLPVIALYILKIRRRGQVVSHLPLWDKLLVETQARSLFQKLRRLYSLLLQLAILASLVFALARPSGLFGNTQGTSTVLVLDVSSSMNTLEDPSTLDTRFDLMLERALEIVDDRNRGDEMLIVSMGADLRILSPFTRSTVQLREGLKHAVPTQTALDMPGLLQFTDNVLADRENTRMILLSDGDGGSVPSALAELESTHWLPIGEATENVGIARFYARRNPSLGVDALSGELINHGAEAQEVRLELLLNDRTVKVMDYTLEPGKNQTFEHQMELPEGGTLNLKLTPEDAYLADNEAWAVLPPRRLRKVALIAPDLDRAKPVWVALESMASAISTDSFMCSASHYESMSPEERAADITLCMDELPPSLPANGNFILLATDIPGGVPAKITGSQLSPSVREWNQNHILCRYLNLEDLALPKSRTLELSGGEALVQSFEGPLLAAFDLPARKVLYVAFDVTDELFPFRIAFPLLLRNSVAWFESEEDVLVENLYAPGQVIEPIRKVPAGDAFVSYLRGDEVIREALPLTDGTFRFDKTEESGVYLFTLAGGSFATAVNLFDGQESSITIPESIGDGNTGAQLSNAWFQGELWPWLAWIALALWALEWFTFHRRLTE